MKHALLSLVVVLASCAPPPPRDVAWFEAHPDDAAKVVKACAAGDRSNECENARTAISRLTAEARKERYRRGFE